MENDLKDLEIKIGVLTERVTRFMEVTTEYRKSLCGKIDDINKKMSDLPCKERKGVFDSINRQIMFMWIILGGAIAKIITDWAGK